MSQQHSQDASAPESLRAQKKSRHRQALIEAAAQAVQRHGVRGATIDRIQQISGLSRGMISLHFGSKDNLLLEVVARLAADYTLHWRARVEAQSGTPDRQLRALIEADFAPEVLNRHTMIIWFAFRAEMHADPQYRPYVDTRDLVFRDTLLSCCQALAGPGQARYAAQSADALTALIEGMWTDFHLNPDDFDRAEAIETCLTVVRRLFPGFAA